MLEFLYENHARLDTRDTDGRTLLLSACEAQVQPNMVSWLLKHGANVSAKDHAGKTAMNYARKQGDQRIIRLIKAALSGSRE